jgi:hypothetical protein
MVGVHGFGLWALTVAGLWGGVVGLLANHNLDLDIEDFAVQIGL